LSVIRFAFRNGTAYVVFTGYVEMLRGAKGTSAELREKKNENWQLPEPSNRRPVGVVMRA
jgi:hypothetical protein